MLRLPIIMSLGFVAFIACDEKSKDKKQGGRSHSPQIFDPDFDEPADEPTGEGSVTPPRLVAEPAVLRLGPEYKAALAKAFDLKQSDLDSVYSTVIDSLPHESDITEKTMHVGFLTGITQLAAKACELYYQQNLHARGIAQGYDSGELQYLPNVWKGSFNDGEFTVKGPSTTPPSSWGFKVGSTFYPLGNVNSGIAAIDNNIGYGFIMYRENIRQEGPNKMTPHGENSDNLITVRYAVDKWQYDNNDRWINFTPLAGDRLIAFVDFSRDTVQPLLGKVRDNTNVPTTLEGRLDQVYAQIFLREDAKKPAKSAVTELLKDVTDPMTAFNLGCATAAATLAFY